MALMRVLLAFALIGGCVTKDEVFDPDGDHYSGDGYGPNTDCDPEDSEVFPESPFEASRGPNDIDDDCDGEIDEPFDADQDRALAPPFGDDCDDADDTVYPGATEIVRDGKDNDCDGLGTPWRDTIDLDLLDEGGDDQVMVLSDGAGRSGSALAGLSGLGDGRRARVAIGAPSTGTGELEVSRFVYAAAAAECPAELSSDESAPGAVPASCLSLELVDTYSDPSGADAAQMGWSVSEGDYNGDNCADLAIGMSSGQYASKVSLVLGYGGGAGCDGTSGDIELSDAVRKDAVVFVGDVGADGYDDLLVGVVESEDTVARLYAGQSEMDGASRAITLAGTSGARRVVAPAGDVDGDGLADVLIGLPDRLDAGTVYLLLGDSGYDDIGSADGDDIALEEDGALAEADLRFDGETGWELGAALAGACDLDGDGDDDIVLGAPGATNAWGQPGGVALVYVTLPKAAGLDDAISFAGTSSAAKAGASLVLPGDASGDGTPDLLVGSDSDGGEERSVGRAWLVLDPVADLEPGQELALLASDRVVAFFSKNPVLWTVAAAGDIDDVPSGPSDRANGVELLVANPYDGKVYLFWGAGF